MQKKILGVLGGMGPAASARFYSMLTEFTLAEDDGAHMEILLHSLPQIPDRTDFILGKSALSPMPAMRTSVLRLAEAGAGLIAVPCNTAEFFHGGLQALCPVPILRTAYESARFAAMRRVKKLGIIATEGTVKAGIYEKHLTALGVGFALPSAEMQAEISSLIYGSIKKSLPCDESVLLRAARELKKEGCDAAVLGCTELSLVPIQSEHEFFIDSLAVLAARCVALCGYPLSEKGRRYSPST